MATKNVENSALNKDQGEMQQQVLPLALVHGEAVVEKPQDLFIPPDALEIILEAFEGPLDLLLYLIRKQKFDIIDLPIADITHQYMEYVEVMKSLKLELAAEYLVMAAILAEIKSRLLLPKTTVEDDEEDPRAELVRRLQEYEVIKQAAEEIEQLPRLERDIHLTNVDLPESYKPRVVEVQVDLQDLMLAMQGVLKRAEAFEHHHIQRENLSTRERMSEILSRLQSAGFVEFSQLFQVQEGRSGVVVTFLAILELIKESLIECVQSQVFGRIQVKAV
ncbi:segregation and condensation protein A [Thalassotalea mangrovi]|uniref:Segregation and condensation protein A n=1 Tax=Thalassotalea mangrovi TaxID=2572245 RepID=A0A4U1B4I0_9GAMM|nr:ScpA family protein [Thalassotalea mangrovi]TKB45144.1 segregation/condensation protein A [Thalassotalea mangrovi]